MYPEMRGSCGTCNSGDARGGLRPPAPLLRTSRSPIIVAQLPAINAPLLPTPHSTTAEAVGPLTAAMRAGGGWVLRPPPHPPLDVSSTNYSRPILRHYPPLPTSHPRAHAPPLSNKNSLNSDNPSKIQQTRPSSPLVPPLTMEPRLMASRHNPTASLWPRLLHASRDERNVPSLLVCPRSRRLHAAQNAPNFERTCLLSIFSFLFVPSRIQKKENNCSI